MIRGNPIDCGDRLCFRALRVDRVLGPGHNRNPCRLSRVCVPLFCRPAFQNFRAGPDEGNPGLLACPRQRRIFRQKTVAGMDRIDLFFDRQRYDSVHIQIGLDRAFTLPDQVRFVRLEAV